MWGPRYFARRFWPLRYFPVGGEAVAAVRIVCLRINQEIAIAIHNFNIVDGAGKACPSDNLAQIVLTTASYSLEEGNIRHQKAKVGFNPGLNIAQATDNCVEFLANLDVSYFQRQALRVVNQ